MASIQSPKERCLLPTAHLGRRTQTMTKLATRWSRFPASPRPQHLLDRPGRQNQALRRSRSLLQMATFPVAVVRNERPRRRQHPLANPPDNRARKRAIRSGILAAVVTSTNMLIARSLGIMIDRGGGRLKTRKVSLINTELTHMTIPFRWAASASKPGGSRRRQRNLD